MTLAFAPTNNSLRSGSTLRPISRWLVALVILGAILTAAGGILALVRPEILLESGQHMNQAARIYANYLVSRNLAMSVMLVVLLVIRARRILAAFMVLIAFVQVFDAFGDATTGRASLLPIVIVFAAAFLLGAARLAGAPFWRAEAWQDRVVG